MRARIDRTRRWIGFELNLDKRKIVLAPWSKLALVIEWSTLEG